MVSSSTQKSTIVRLSHSIRMAVVRATFGTLERAAPGLGARWAERLWLTLPRYAGNHGEPALPLAETFTVSVRGRPVAGRAWGNGPVVYLVHGWGGLGSQLDAFIQPLLATGHRVITFDALSHGASSPGTLGPRRSTIPEMADALTAVVAEHGPAHAIIAHSLGSAGVFYALRHGLAARRLVFLAPMTQPEPYTILFSAALGFGERIRLRMQDRVAARVGVPWTDFDMPRWADRLDPRPSLLLVHDPRDRETRYADSIALHKAWPGAQLRTVTELGHWRILRDPSVVGEAISFVAAKRDPARQVS
jgi:pimeloyl-ACP methyl ester carboxylesterase